MTTRTCATCAYARPSHDMLDDARPLPEHRKCGVLLPPWVGLGGLRTVLANATCDLHAEARGAPPPPKAGPDPAKVVAMPLHHIAGHLYVTAEDAAAAVTEARRQERAHG